MIAGTSGLPINPIQPLLAQSPPWAPHPDLDAGDEQAAPTRESLARMMDVQVRVWAELGRTTLPLGQALELPPGAVVELDQDAESPIELFVNGTRFAHGTLLDTGGEWAVTDRRAGLRRSEQRRAAFKASEATPITGSTLLGVVPR